MLSLLIQNIYIYISLNNNVYVISKKLVSLSGVIHFTGKEQKMKVAIGRKEKKKAGKREEWEEGEDATQYFTMDYSRVRRRRPIHNKSTPVAP